MAQRGPVIGVRSTEQLMTLAFGVAGPGLLGICDAKTGAQEDRAHIPDDK
jgi:hypothetical protein